MKLITKVRKIKKVIPLKKRRNNGRDGKGRFAIGSCHSTGRPTGSKNKTTQELKELFGAYAERIAMKIIFQALAGSETSQRLIFERLVPPLKSVGVGFDGGIATNSEIILQAMGAGTIDLEAGKQILESMLVGAKISELTSLEQRVRQLEIGAKENN